ncbi:protein kinase domain-containing protein [Streptomyces sp. 4N509B]|uniref:protein kinase domain-containing protein n=1 Tax=Streptomyces sp. 4N509B TaxID=3457413 RepID=UPI003FD40533
MSSTNSSSALSPLGPDDPREIADYRLLARLGEGGMGTVYLSRTRGGQPVALKLIRREYARDEAFRRRFAQEVAAARRVRGYHLVAVVDHVLTDELPWLASEFVPGVTLEDALDTYGPLPLPAVFQLVGSVAQALAAIHAAGVVHRDLKPANLMLTAQGPYVIDFGIARAADATRLTRARGIVGTPQFMSPEQGLNEPVGPAADLFALGLTAAVAATGRHPYGDGGALTVATQIALTAQRPPELSGYPAALRPLLERCLTASPEERITPAEVVELYERSQVRPLRDFDGWLPEPLTEQIARRVAELENPPPPESPRAEADTPTVPPEAVTPAPTAPPTYTPTAAPSQPRSQHRATTVAAPAGPPPSQPSPPSPPRSSPPPVHSITSARPAPTPSAGRPTSRARRVGLAAVVAVAVLLLGQSLVSALLPDDSNDDPSGSDTSGGSETTDDPTGEEAPDGADDGTGPNSSPSPETEPYDLLVDAVPFALRAGDYDNTYADYDAPAASSDLDLDDVELTVGDGLWDRWEFETTTGISDGRTPEECRLAAGTNALAPELPYEEFEDTIPVGTLLCTLTTEGNVAMLEVTDLTPTDDTYEVSTLLTVWQER